MQRCCCQAWAYPESFGDGIDVIALVSAGLGFFFFRLSTAQPLLQLLLDIFFSAFRTQLFTRQSVKGPLIKVYAGLIRKSCTTTTSGMP